MKKKSPKADFARGWWRFWSIADERSFWAFVGFGAALLVIAVASSMTRLVLEAFWFWLRVC